MASHQVSNQRDRSPRTHQAPARRSESQYSEAEHELGYLGDVAEQASDYMARGASHVRDLARGREGTAVAVALAAGVGIGLVLGAALIRSQREQQGWRARIAAEGFGQRLRERFEKMIPEAVAEHFGR
jgi:hypothetical protein